MQNLSRQSGTAVRGSILDDVFCVAHEMSIADEYGVSSDKRSGDGHR